ncbi:DMT family transporter [Butyrivibrio sp. YAB3001]|uniref:DMT family transporter n=1 Tax=Butyrivibrio sp. YAB3001 TaxID=1520812 RepID=UPI0008F64C99|nr:EamA family transporter [Butyrivibrio sp. YAB3001]SFC28021.1 Permease of the drug/metabolite transporter (DMT) superfamily [Butyrivibrio sp. YAB3001]
MKNNLKGIIYTLLGATCWGLSGSMGQYLFTVQQMDSKWLVPIRLGLAGILILLYCLIKHPDPVFKPWKSAKLAKWILIYGIAGVSTCQFLYFLTIELSNAAMGTILQDLAPIFILAFTCITAKRLPRSFEIISILLAISGVFLLTTHGDFRHISLPLPALVAGIGSAFCVMVYNVLAPKITAIVPVIVAQGWSFLLGGIFLGIAFRSWKIHYVPNLMGTLGILFVVVIGNICAFTLYISGVSKIGPQKAILYSFAEPITAALISTFVLKSAFTIYDAIGFGLIFMMLFFITFGSKDNNSDQKTVDNAA